MNKKIRKLKKKHYNSKLIKGIEFDDLCEYDTDENITYIMFEENMGAGIGHTSTYFYALIFFILTKKKHLKYLHKSFTGHSANFEKILNYKYFSNPISREKFDSLEKYYVEKIEDFDIKKKLLIVKSDWFFDDISHLLRDNIKPLLTKNLKNIYFNCKDEINYKQDHINITIHIRRGDIMKNNTLIKGMESRFLSNDYFLDILKNITELKLGNLNINLLSEGNITDFKIFNDFNVRYILDDSFEKIIGNLIFNDILITSPSGLSDIATIYKNDGIVIVPSEKYNVLGMWRYYISNAFYKDHFIRSDKILSNKNIILDKINSNKIYHKEIFNI
jgi:hypothetical protein